MSAFKLNIPKHHDKKTDSLAQRFSAKVQSECYSAITRTFPNLKSPAQRTCACPQRNGWPVLTLAANKRADNYGNINYALSRKTLASRAASAGPSVTRAQQLIEAEPR